MSKSIEEILAPKPEVKPRIYAYAIHDAAHAGRAAWGRLGRPVGAGDFCALQFPLALPLAGAACPFRAMAAASANGASHPQPRATPWVVSPPPPFSPEGAT